MKTKTKKLLFALFTVAGLLLLPFHIPLLQFSSVQATDDTKEFNNNETRTAYNQPQSMEDDKYIFDKNLTIKAGVHLKLSRQSRITVHGDLIIEGTENNPVVFEGLNRNTNAFNYAVNVNGDSNVNIAYAIFEYGGGYNCLASAPSNFLNVARADSCIPDAALEIETTGKVSISNSTFDHNYRGINYLAGSGDSSFTENIFHHNTNEALYSEPANLNAKRNCWMRPSGPTHPNNPGGLGEKIEGNVDFSNWKDCGTDHEPVLIIPGIGGSWNWDKMLGSVFSDKWDFSPTDHTYESLVKSFENKGYQKGKDLRIVFYDWRKDNHESAENFLIPIIDDLKKVSFDEKYDIVAHSMGGIVTMDYLHNHGDQAIDKVVLLGTPLGGSAKAYPVWEGGTIPKDWNVLWYYLQIWKFKNINIFTSDYDFINEHIPSTKQLLPIYNYTIPKGSSDPAYYDEMQEYNQYLNDLFWSTNNLFGDNTLIIEGSDVPTTKMIDVKEYQGANQGKIWKDGIPVFDPLHKDETQGDGTVVNASSAFDFLPTDPNHPLFPGAKSEKLSGTSHAQLPTASTAKIHDFLFAQQPPHGDYPLPSENKLVFTFASPVDVKIIASDGKYITKSENTIGKAFYYSDGQSDGPKIVEVEDPASGIYKVELTGNGNGEYHMLASKQNGENNDESEKQGQITVGQILNYKVDTAAENFEIQPEQSADTTPPSIGITSPGGKTYSNDQAIPVEYAITDDMSAEGEIVKNIQLDGQVFSGNIIDLSLQKIGGHKLKIIAVDKAGNKSEKEVAFQVTTNLNAIQNNINHYWELKLIKTKCAKRFLTVRLNQLENLFNLLEKTKNSNLKPKPKQVAVDALKKVINADINLLVRQINRKSPRGIDTKVAGLLVEDLNYIRP